jgi:hypothetical protein
MILCRARAVLDQAQELTGETRELVAQARVVAQASADSRRARVQGEPPRLRPEVLRRSEHARLLAQLETMPVIEQAKGIIAIMPAMAAAPRGCVSPARDVGAVAAGGVG